MTRALPVSLLPTRPAARRAGLGRHPTWVGPKSVPGWGAKPRRRPIFDYARSPFLLRSLWPAAPHLRLVMPAPERVREWWEWARMAMYVAVDIALILLFSIVMAA